ncbi:E3 ubiquitin-protein ligase MIB2-like isoform X2 [Dreissena polymorpha]|uniref:E3 ubiquitin-protein ligase MIB2-like isoform X2 n=1 Tax=Dreissena polymorpha TaxID=45954 RepID=UPI002264284B|nr:E3 ubiquitin-protein ligase MIB2-like isoform X2 [Dreissena polymorpha]
MERSGCAKNVTVVTCATAVTALIITISHILVNESIDLHVTVRSAAEFGTVTEVISLEDGDKRDAVNVTWQDGSTSTCMVGFQGKIDLVCVEEMPGLEYYREHMAVLDTSSSSEASSKAGSRAEDVEPESKPIDPKPKPKPGDTVCVDVQETTIRELQWGHGGWNKEMNHYIGKYGKVNHIEKNGDYVIDYSGTKFRFNPEAIRKVPSLKFGDTVKLIEDAQKAQMLQQAHGGWTTEYGETLGKIDKVVKIDTDGDVAVEFGDTAFVFNAACCEPVTKPMIDRIDVNNSITSQPERNNSDRNLRRENGINTSLNTRGGELARHDPLASVLEESLRGMQELLQNLASLSQGLMHDMLNPSPANMGIMLLMHSAAANDIAMLTHILQNHQELVNAKHQGLTALTIASHEGHTRVAELLLAAGADVNLADDKGHTALMTALSRSKEDIALLLIRFGADINMRNKTGSSTLHLCASGQANKVLEVLLQQTPDLNVQDDIRGDTPLNIAILAENTDGALMLLAEQTIQLDIPNKTGHTAFTLAVMRGNERIVKAIVERSPDLVILHSPVGGYNVLHVAAANDHSEVIKILLQANANVNKLSKQDFIPLHLSCKEGYFKSAKLLIEAGSQVNAEDKEGDTPLHLCVSQMRTTGSPMSMMHMLLRRGDKLTKEIKERIELGCLLINHGASIHVTNKAGLKPLQACRHDHMKNVLLTCSEMQSANIQRFSPNIEIPSRRKETNLFVRVSTRISTHCANCKERIVDLLLQPCNHLAVCGACACSLSICPVCGDKIVADFDRDGNKVTGHNTTSEKNACNIC